MLITEDLLLSTSWRSISCGGMCRVLSKLRRHCLGDLFRDVAPVAPCIQKYYPLPPPAGTIFCSKVVLSHAAPLVVQQFLNLGIFQCAFSRLWAAQGCLAGFIFDVCTLFCYNSVAVGLDLHPGARLGPYCFGGLLGCVQCGAQHMQCSKRTYGSCQGPMILASKTICLQLCGYLNG